MSNNDHQELINLGRILAHTYGNATRHDTASPDSSHSRRVNSASKPTDLVLEDASIRLASRIALAITAGACPGGEPETTGTDAPSCVLDDESVGLRNLTDTLSYAASQLQRSGASSDPRRDSETLETAETLETTRVHSMEHLYRMTFAISKAYLYRSQSRTYIEAARQQLELARKYIQAEQDLCSCNLEEYRAELLKLSELDDRLSLVRPAESAE